MALQHQKKYDGAQTDGRDKYALAICMAMMKTMSKLSMMTRSNNRMLKRCEISTTSQGQTIGRTHHPHHFPFHLNFHQLDVAITHGQLWYPPIHVGGFQSDKLSIYSYMHLITLTETNFVSEAIIVPYNSRREISQIVAAITG